MQLATGLAPMASRLLVLSTAARHSPPCLLEPVLPCADQAAYDTLKQEMSGHEEGSLVSARAFPSSVTDSVRLLRDAPLALRRPSSRWCPAFAELAPL